MYDRLPRILTTRVDYLARAKEEIVEQYGPAAREELKEVIGNISKLKYELQTDKEFSPFEETTPEFVRWNKFIEMIEGIGGKKSYFSTPWLYSECLLYRKLKLIFERTESLKDFDYFKDQKDHTLVSMLPSIKAIASFLDSSQINDDQERHNLFIKLLKLNLWGNRCDLSVSGGTEVQISDGVDPFVRIPQLDEFILADHTEQIWACLTENTSAEVAIICDNAGYELFTDLILADYIIEQKLASKVVFHLKAIPWFVSDALEGDFMYLLNFLESQDVETLKKLGARGKNRLNVGQFAIHKPVDLFWTTGYEFPKMKEVDSDLYQRLSQAHLLIIKGDLNYRKLMSDCNWDPATPFKVALKGFAPTNLCALRTVKADTVSGLQPGVAEKLRATNELWMKDGDYGVIQFAHK